MFKAFSSACGLPLIDVCPTPTTLFLFTITQPTAGLRPVFPCANFAW
tara:strand:- start:2561 stop:2701 length:141 start_codon:yes stop_codon:yes gene_type:complete